MRSDKRAEDLRGQIDIDSHRQKGLLDQILQSYLQFTLTYIHDIAIFPESNHHLHISEVLHLLKQNREISIYLFVPTPFCLSSTMSICALISNAQVYFALLSWNPIS